MLWDPIERSKVKKGSCFHYVHAIIELMCRWQDFPGRGYDIRHPNDNSVQTLRGHHVATTLIRAYWSPMHTTGQRFVYSGSADGSVYIYGRSR